MRSKPAPTSRTTVRFEIDGPVATVIIDRPRVRNAVDAHTADQLAECFLRFEADRQLAVAVLTGAGDTFCAGFDLKSLAAGQGRVTKGGHGPTSRRGWGREAHRKEALVSSLIRLQRQD